MQQGPKILGQAGSAEGEAGVQITRRDVEDIVLTEQGI
jgi:hypothetical protein